MNTTHQHEGYTHTDADGVHHVTVRTYGDLGDTTGTPRVYTSAMLADEGDPYKLGLGLDFALRVRARDLLTEARGRRCGLYAWHHARCAAADNPQSLCSFSSPLL